MLSALQPVKVTKISTNIRIHGACGRKKNKNKSFSLKKIRLEKLYSRGEDGDFEKREGWRCRGRVRVGRGKGESSWEVSWLTKG